MPGKISAKQKEILEYIKSEILSKGYPPAVREICEAVDLKSTSSVHSHLETLEKNGYIRRDPTKPRAIEILDDDFNLTRKQANIIKIQSVKIKNLVQDLNLVSQLNYNVQPVKQTPVHLCKMIREIVVEYLNNNLNNKFDFELNLDCNTEQISIIGDERLLYRAIQNIISNSINHNENGCTISVSLAVNGNNLILVISDNGKGISEEKLQKIQSTPHYLQSTDERLDLRHGLGLLLVKEIISIHNGTVSISSALNNGFSTTISLPIKKQ